MDTNKFKIICIVKNDCYDNNRGLIRAFNEQTNKFIETYFYKEQTEFSELFGNQTIYKYLLLNQNSVVHLNVPPNKNDVWDILLVCDNVDAEATKIDEIKEINKIPFTPETLVMYHQEPTAVNDYFKTLQEEKKILKCMEGHHESNTKDGYLLLLDLTKAWNDTDFNPQEYNQAKEKLIHWFGLNEKLNAALEFLHQSLDNKFAVTDILTRNGLFKLDTKIPTKDKTLKDLIEYKENKTHNEALKDVRDALLEIAL